MFAKHCTYILSLICISTDEFPCRRPKYSASYLSPCAYICKKKSPRPDSPVQAMIFWPGTRHGRPDVHRARELEPACWNDWDSGFMEATESNTATIGTSWSGQSSYYERLCKTTVLIQNKGGTHIWLAVNFRLYPMPVKCYTAEVLSIHVLLSS